MHLHENVEIKKGGGNKPLWVFRLCRQTAAVYTVGVLKDWIQMPFAGNLDKVALPAILFVACALGLTGCAGTGSVSDFDERRSQIAILGLLEPVILVQKRESNRVKVDHDGQILVKRNLRSLMESMLAPHFEVRVLSDIINDTAQIYRSQIERLFQELNESPNLGSFRVDDSLVGFFNLFSESYLLATQVKGFSSSSVQADSETKRWKGLVAHEAQEGNSSLELRVAVIDRHTGEVLYHRVEEEPVSPRDRENLKDIAQAALDRLFQPSAPGRHVSRNATQDTAPLE